jgi:hypothetical protein
MATRSGIHVQMTNGQWAGIYCHSDGYWSWNGQKLHEFYNSQALAEALIRLGDISIINEEIGEKHDFDYRNKLYKKYTKNFDTDYVAMHNDPEYVRLSRMCNVYGRDRGEKNTQARRGPTLASVLVDESYVYVWRDGQWFGTNEYIENDDAIHSALIASLRPLKDILFLENIKRDESGWPETIRRRTSYRPPPPTKRAIAL